MDAWCVASHPVNLKCNCKVMVVVEVRVTTKVPVRATDMDEKPISRDYTMARKLS